MVDKEAFLKCSLFFLMGFLKKNSQYRSSTNIYVIAIVKERYIYIQQDIYIQQWSRSRLKNVINLFYVISAVNHNAV